MTCPPQNEPSIAISPRDPQHPDDLQDYHLFPQVYYYQARAQEGLRSSGAVESYRKFLALKQKSKDDPLPAEAKRKAGVQQGS